MDWNTEESPDPHPGNGGDSSNRNDNGDIGSGRPNAERATELGSLLLQVLGGTSLPPSRPDEAPSPAAESAVNRNNTSSRNPGSLGQEAAILRMLLRGGMPRQIGRPAISATQRNGHLMGQLLNILRRTQRHPSASETQPGSTSHCVNVSDQLPLRRLLEVLIQIQSQQGLPSRGPDNLSQNQGQQQQRSLHEIARRLIPLALQSRPPAPRTSPALSPAQQNSRNSSNHPRRRDFSRPQGSLTAFLESLTREQIELLSDGLGLDPVSLTEHPSPLPHPQHSPPPNDRRWLESGTQGIGMPSMQSPSGVVEGAPTGDARNETLRLLGRLLQLPQREHVSVPEADSLGTDSNEERESREGMQSNTSFPFHAGPSSSRNHRVEGRHGIPASRGTSTGISGMPPSEVPGQARGVDSQTLVSSLSVLASMLATPSAGAAASMASTASVPAVPAGSRAAEEREGTSTLGAASAPGVAADENGNKDDAHDLPKRPRVRPRRGYQHEPFPRKLHRIIREAATEGNDDIIAFTPSGRGFRIGSIKRFSNELIPRYFRHSKYSSFLRSLNLYGFEKVKLGPEVGSFAHECFRRDRPDLCDWMARRADQLPSQREPGSQAEVKKEPK